MTVGELTVDLKCDTSAFKQAMAEVTTAVEALDAAITKLRATGIEISAGDATPKPPPPDTLLT